MSSYAVGPLAPQLAKGDGMGPPSSKRQCATGSLPLSAAYAGGQRKALTVIASEVPHFASKVRDEAKQSLFEIASLTAFARNDRVYVIASECSERSNLTAVF